MERRPRELGDRRQEVLQCIKRIGGHFSLRLELVTSGNVFKTSVPIPFQPLSSFPKHDALYIVKEWKL